MCKACYLLAGWEHFLPDSNGRCDNVISGLSRTKQKNIES